MSFPAVIYPPNRPLERQLEPSKVPVLYDYLLFLDANEKGEFILGSSNITGAYWEGVLCHYRNANAAFDNDYCGYYISSSSTTDAKFLKGSSRVVLAEDSGHLSLLALNDIGDPSIKCVDILGVNARVEQIAVSESSSKVVTCADKTLAIWDITAKNELLPIMEYVNYHTESIASVDINKNQGNLFASASSDGRVCTWDDRMEMPGVVLYESEFGGMTSVSWNATQPLHLAAGSRNGSVYYLDMRTPKEFVSRHHCFDADVHKLAFNSNGYLAVCGDTPEVLVMDSKDDLNIIYKSKAHKGFVRGLTWLDNALYTCAFDRKIVKHTV